MLLMLLIQLFDRFKGLDYYPPLTVVCLVINIYAHLAPNANILGYYLDDIAGNCIQPSHIVHSLIYDHKLLLNRIFLSSIIHADDMHLYYNMLSLSWKGIKLETSMGSEAFFVLLLFSLTVSHTVMVIMSTFLHFAAFNNSVSSFNSCAVGFSAVLFALKYVLNSQEEGSTNVFGIAVLTKYACWIELVMISVLTPNASFLGHLAGIFSGVLYRILERRGAFVRTVGALRRIVTNLLGISAARARNNNSSSNNVPRTRYTYAHGTASSSGRDSKCNNANIGIGGDID